MLMKNYINNLTYILYKILLFQHNSMYSIQQPNNPFMQYKLPNCQRNENVFQQKKYFMLSSCQELYLLKLIDETTLVLLGCSTNTALTILLALRPQKN